MRQGRKNAFKAHFGERVRNMKKWVLCRDNDTGSYFIILGEDIAAKCKFCKIIDVFDNVFLAYSARDTMEGVKTE